MHEHVNISRSDMTHFRAAGTFDPPKIDCYEEDTFWGVLLAIGWSHTDTVYISRGAQSCL